VVIRSAKIFAGVALTGFLLVGPAIGAEPHAYQLLTETSAPRAGSSFTGAALTVFHRERLANGYRSVTLGCTPGTATQSGRTVRVPVRVVTMRWDPHGGPGPVESVSTFTWSLPRSLTGKWLKAGYTVTAVNADGTKGVEGGRLAWTIRPPR
jgi:hypothetical protein